MPLVLQVIGFSKLFKSLNNVNCHYLWELNRHGFSVQSILEKLASKLLLIVNLVYVLSLFLLRKCSNNIIKKKYEWFPYISMIT